MATPPATPPKSVISSLFFPKTALPAATPPKSVISSLFFPKTALPAANFIGYATAKIESLQKRVESLEATRTCGEKGKQLIHEIDSMIKVLTPKLSAQSNDVKDRLYQLTDLLRRIEVLQSHNVEAKLHKLEENHTANLSKFNAKYLPKRRSRRGQRSRRGSRRSNRSH